jgi:hypothetical protein
VLVLDGVHVHLAEPRRDRPHDRLDAGREATARFAESLADLLSREVDVHAVLEDGGDLREAVARE